MIGDFKRLGRSWPAREAPAGFTLLLGLAGLPSTAVGFTVAEPNEGIHLSSGKAFFSL